MATYLNLIKKLMKPDAIPFARHARTMSELVTGVVLPYKMQGKAPRRHLLVVVAVPREAKCGSIYHLRIAQNVEGQITGGYTAAIKVR